MKTYKIRLHDSRGAKVNYYDDHYTKEMTISENDPRYKDELNDLSSWLANYAIHYGVAISEEAAERIDQNYTVEQIVKEYQDIIDGIILEVEDSEE